MRIKVIWSDFTAHMKTWYRSKGTMFWSIFFPVLLMLLFGAIFSGIGDSTFTLHVQDLDDSAWSRGYINNLTKTGALEIETIPAGVDVYKYIADEGLRSALVIPKGLGDNITMEFLEEFGVNQTMGILAGFGVNMSMETLEGLEDNMNSSAMSSLNITNLTLLLDPTQESSNGILRGIVNGVSGGFNAGITQIISPEAHDTIGVEEKSIIQEEFQYIDFFLPGIIGLTILTSAVYGTIFRNTKYRENGILRKLVTTPMKQSEWLVAMMLFMTFTSLLSTAVILVVGILVYDVGLNLNPLFMVIIIAASFAFAGIGMIISRFVHEEETADSAGGAVTFPMMFLAGTFFPLETMPVYLQSVAKFLPLYYVNEGLRDSMIYGDVAGALTNTAVVLALAVAFFGVGVILTKWKE